MTRKRLLLVVLVGVLLVAAATPIVWQHRDLLRRETLETLIQSVAALSPWVFFGLLAVLPLAGVPVSPFLLAAPAFGLPIAIVGSLIALASNMAIGWLIAGKLFRPFFERVVSRFGYSVPELSPRSMISMAIMLRIMPGMPFPLQNYLLGLARMPFGRYMAVSVPTNAVMVSGIIVAGGAIVEGSGKMALLAMALVIGVGIALKTMRDRYRRKALESELREVS